ncbi:hypothetical protein ES703_79520 [subsurface metagenome]
MFLSCIFSEIIQFDRAVIEELNELPVVLPYRPRRPPAEKMRFFERIVPVQHDTPRFSPGVLQQRHDGNAVKVLARVRPLPRELQKRRVEINIAGRRVAHTALFHHPRLADAALVKRGLARSKRSVRSYTALTAVVACKD